MKTRNIKPIPDCPYYFAGDDGTIWTNRRKGGNDPSANRVGPLRRMKCRTSSGYAVVALSVSGRVVTRQVHRLVLEAFVGPAPIGFHACHFPDATKSNNKLDNLRWDTPSENMRDKYRHLIGRTTKPCKRCGEVVPLVDFYKDTRAADGRKAECKSCHGKTSIGTRDEDKKRKANREFMRRQRIINPSRWR